MLFTLPIRYSVATFLSTREVSRAQAHLPLAEYDAAVEHLLNARRLTPGDAAASRALGNTYLLIHAFRSDPEYASKALKALRRAALLNPLEARNWNALGWALLTLERYDEAESSLRSALELDPANVYNVFSMAQLFEARGDFATAVQWYERALAIREDAGLRARMERAKKRQ